VAAQRGLAWLKANKK